MAVLKSFYFYMLFFLIQYNSILTMFRDFQEFEIWSTKSGSLCNLRNIAHLIIMHQHSKIEWGCIYLYTVCKSVKIFFNSLIFVWAEKDLCILSVFLCVNQWYIIQLSNDKKKLSPLLLFVGVTLLSFSNISLTHKVPHHFLAYVSIYTVQVPSEISV